MKIIRKYFSTVSFFLILLSVPLISQEINSERDKRIDNLINKFFDKDPFINGEAIDSLVNLGSQSVDSLINSLKNKNDDIRICSAIALYKMAPKYPNTIPFLIAALNDKNSEVRWNSAIALGKYKKEAEGAVNSLLLLLHDDDPDVRWAAYISLSKINKDVINTKPDIKKTIKILETLTPKLIDELKVPGVTISVINNFQIAWSGCFGVSDAEKQNKVTNQTVFEACSMSKPVFTYIVLKLADEGKLELDRPLYEYMDERFISIYDDYYKLITARMILTHTGGMPNWRKGGDERGAPLPLYFKPGSKFNYSGEGFYLLQRVVEHITNVPLEVLAKKILFDKLGFKSTGFVWSGRFANQISTGHDTSGKCKSKSYYTHANAAYTLYTTAEEYAGFIIELMKSNISNARSLSDSMKCEMFKHQVRADVREVIDRPGRALGLFSYRGLGWGIDSTITGNIIYHSGANQTGFRCYSQFNVEDGSGIVIMTNGTNGGELWKRLISATGDL